VANVKVDFGQIPKSLALWAQEGEEAAAVQMTFAAVATAEDVPAWQWVAAVEGHYLQ
jgi:hypothetical protein